MAAVFVMEVSCTTEAPPDRIEVDDAELVRIPGGMIHPSCIHEVPDGAKISGDDVIVGGRVVDRLSPCPFEMKRDPPRSQTAGPAGRRATRVPTPVPVDGYYAYAYGWTAASQYVHTVVTYWTVPAKPAVAYTGAQIFYAFPGIEDKGAEKIMQPVMQFDATSNDWTMQDYWVRNDRMVAAKGPKIVVYPGEEIKGEMSITNCPDNSGIMCEYNINFYVTARLEETIRSISVTPDLLQTVAFKMAIEAYGLLSCRDSFPHLPSSTFGELNSYRNTIKVATIGNDYRFPVNVTNTFPWNPFTVPKPDPCAAMTVDGGYVNSDYAIFDWRDP